MKVKFFLIFIGLILLVANQTIAEAIIPSKSVSYENSKTNETTVEGSLNELFSAVDINERLGDTNKISSIGDGTISDAISSIQTQLNGKAASSHDHNSIYYTETEINNLLNAKQNSSTAITTSNIGSQSVNYANSAGSATSSNTATTAANLGRSGNAGVPMIFNWSGQGGQPSWLWGGNDGTNMYVYNPSNFSVNYANSAGSANAVAWNNVSGKPSSYTPASHNQAASTITTAYHRLDNNPAPVGGTYTVESELTKYATVIKNINNTLGSKQNALGYTPVQQGGGVGQNSNKLYLGWDSNAYALRLTVDATDIGHFSMTSGSSKLIKENIKDITDEEALKILDVDIVSFDYKENFYRGKKNNFGVIAEQVKDIIPSAVVVPENYDEANFDEEKGMNQDLLTVEYNKFVPHLIKMVQIQQEKIEKLEKEINELKK